MTEFHQLTIHIHYQLEENYLIDMMRLKMIYIQSLVVTQDYERVTMVILVMRMSLRLIL